MHVSRRQNITKLVFAQLDTYALKFNYQIE